MHHYTKIQIHLMFLFSFGFGRCYRFTRNIQIHLMFLFIKKCEFCGANVYKFKYISCSCLSVLAILVTAELLYSNTSHVLVYPFPFGTSPEPLSHSNTSHVLVYQNKSDEGSITLKVFKYISCSCLSNVAGRTPLPPIPFKYISCSCLSNEFPLFLNQSYTFSLENTRFSSFLPAVTHIFHLPGKSCSFPCSYCITRIFSPNAPGKFFPILPSILI